MGVNICICEKQTENVIKESSIDCYKKKEPYCSAMVITANSFQNLEGKIHLNGNKPILFDSNNINPVLTTAYSIKQNISKKSQFEEKYIKNIIKIQSFYRNYLKRKNNNEHFINNEKEDSLSLKINLKNTESFFSSNSLKNSNISQEKENKTESNNIMEKVECNVICPFNLKNKLKMNYKYSGYVKKKIRKINSMMTIKNISDDSNMLEQKEAIDKEEKLGLIKQGFGKLIFNDGTEFCGIFKDNILQIYGKYSNINRKDKINIGKNNDKNEKEKEKEIIITDNTNYEEFFGEYKDYISNGFGVYKNYITNLKISGIFNKNGISEIGIEDSAEGGYIYSGMFNNNKKEGYGTIIWKDGNKYQGQFKNNQLNGYGMIEYPGQKFYQGEIKNGRMDGYGEFFWKDQKKYIGNYKNDKRNGFGVFIFKSNNFKNSLSKYETTNNNDYNSITAYIGFWKNGNMDGFGMKVNSLEIKFGVWENGIIRKYLESNFAEKTFVKWIEKKYHKLFLGNQSYIKNFLEKCINISDEINPINHVNS